MEYQNWSKSQTKIASVQGDQDPMKQQRKQLLEYAELKFNANSQEKSPELDKESPFLKVANQSQLHFSAETKG